MKVKQAAKEVLTAEASAPLVREIKKLKKDLSKATDFTTVLIDAVVASAAALEPAEFEGEHDVKGVAEEVVLPMSDPHFGEVVEADETLGRNRYSSRIATRRTLSIAPHVREIAKIHTRAYPLSKLHVLLAGDFCTGESIFRGQAFSIDRPLIDQVAIGGHATAEAIREMSKSFPVVEVHTIPGNHGRGGFPGQHHRRTNWDRVLYNQVEAELRENDRVSFTHHEGVAALIRVNGHYLAFGHGSDLLRSAGLLGTAMGRVVGRWGGVFRKRIKAFVFGHFHKRGEMAVQDAVVFANGTIMGGTGYGVRVSGEVSPPEQWLIGVHPKRVTWRYALEL